MSAGELEAAMRERGIDAAVQADGAVAVIRVAGGDTSVTDPDMRRALVALALAHGFRNLALEVTD